MKCVCKSVVTARILNVPNFITTKFSKRVMNYVPTVCELVVTMQDDACQCTLCHNWHEQFTRGLCHINKLVRITAWPCFPTHTLTSTLRMAWEVYVEFMSSTRLMHDNGARGCWYLYKTMFVLPEIAQRTDRLLRLLFIVKPSTTPL